MNIKHLTQFWAHRNARCMFTIIKMIIFRTVISIQKRSNPHYGREKRWVQQESFSENTMVCQVLRGYVEIHQTWQSEHSRQLAERHGGRQQDFEGILQSSVWLASRAEGGMWDSSWDWDGPIVLSLVCMWITLSVPGLLVSRDPETLLPLVGFPTSLPFEIWFPLWLAQQGNNIHLAPSH